jgi:DNA anti-recombination protein RmuC
MATTKKDEWNKIAATILKNEIRRNLETNATLAKKLGEDTDVLRNKINRGTFRASFFLKALAALGVRRLQIPNIYTIKNN